MNSLYRNIVLISIVVISTMMHWSHFSKDLVSIHVWRQTQTQSNIVNFYEEDMNIFNPRRNDRGDSDGVFRMEFPIMQWLVATQYYVFGNHILVTRIFMFIIGLLTVLGVFKLLDTLFKNNLISVIGAWAFNFSPSFFYYTINPLPDNFALCCSIWGIATFFSWYNNRKISTLVWSGLFLSLGALSKLPFIIYYIVPITFFTIAIFKNGFTKHTWFNALAVFGFALLPVTWYATVIPHWEGNIIVKGVIDNQVPWTQLFDFYQHNLISILPEHLLNYGSLLFFILGFYFLFKKSSFKDPRFPLLLSLSGISLVYYFFEANAIAKIHDYYLFPFYPLLFILVSYGAFNLYNSKNTFFKFLTVFLLLLLPFTCSLRMWERWDTQSPGFNKDLLIYKNEIRQATPKHALVVVGNDVSHYIFFYYIDRKGWGFSDHNLTPKSLHSMRSKGAEYLYTDSQVILDNEEVFNQIDSLVFTGGSIQIFKLKSPN